MPAETTPAEPTPARWSHTASRVGLALSGGGAKGAYQAGVAACLAEYGVQPRIVCGASIGALNGAVLACGSSPADAAARLKAVWREVAADAGESMAAFPSEAAGPAGQPEATPAALRGLDGAIAGMSSPILAQTYLDDLVRRHVDLTALRGGPPLWASMYPVVFADYLPSWAWLIDVLRAPFTTEGSWVCVSQVASHQIHDVVLASAALPPVLPARSVSGVSYRDGGLFDNTPLGPIAADPDCDVAIVVHLRQGAVWDARAYPGLRVIEIRPTTPLAAPGATGWINGLLDFSPARVEWLIQRGYEDATAALGRIQAALQATHGLRRATAAATAEADLLDHDFPTP
ncbi:patatin-like phospholipase family protein [Spirillospora sp. NBC_00431]